MGLMLHRLFWRLGWVDAPNARGAAVAVYPALVVCEECDAVHARAALVESEVARCTRCGALLGRGHKLGPQEILPACLQSKIMRATFATGFPYERSLNKSWIIRQRERVNTVLQKLCPFRW